jgi:hypothetical protein
VISCAAPARISAPRRHGQLGGAGAARSAVDVGALAAGVTAAGASGVVIASPGSMLDEYELPTRLPGSPDYQHKPQAVTRQHPDALVDHKPGPGAPR